MLFEYKLGAVSPPLSLSMSLQGTREIIFISETRRYIDP